MLVESLKMRGAILLKDAGSVARPTVDPAAVT